MSNPERMLYKTCEDRGCHLVYAIRAGSHLYGTTTPESDEDFGGVFIPGKRALLGFHAIDAISGVGPEPDVMIHEIRKFVQLCMRGNPNILDYLFAPDDCVLVVSHSFSPILAVRDKFLSRLIAPRFGGYVRGHLARMERGVTGHLGDKRKADIEKHGYSTKNGAHLIRLARMGCEAVETGRYNVRRADAEELLSIRRGEWDATRIKEEGLRLVARMDAAVLTSPLPEKPPEAAIEDLVMRTLLQEVRMWNE